MAPADARDRILVGVITGAHGIRGDVRLRSLTEEPDAIGRYGPLSGPKGEVFEIIRLKPQKDDFIASLKGVTDRNRAEGLKGTELWVLRDRLPAPKADEVYAHDLIGLAVVLKDGSELGKIAGVPNYGAGDLLEIRIEGRKDTVLVPFARSYVVAREKDRIVVDLPETYLDEGE